jgi:hypothetical protein
MIPCISADAESVNPLAAGAFEYRPQAERDEHVDSGSVNQLAAKLRPPGRMGVEHDNPTAAVSERSSGEAAGESRANDDNVVIRGHG